MTTVANWFAADTFIHGGRSKSGRTIENNTRVERRGDDIAIRLHDTDVVTYHGRDTIELNSGGWLTLTTKDRMNRYLPTRVRLGSERGIWWVYSLDPREGMYGSWTKVCRFFDGILIDAKTGEVLNPPDPKLEERKREAEKKMRLRIDKYVDGYMKVLAEGMSTPGGGDCWGCSMFERGGIQRNDHLLDHLTESYYVPTLLWNAMKERGYPDVTVIMGMYLDYEAFNRGTQRVRRAWQSDEPDKAQLADFRRVLGKYLRKRLIPTVAA